MNEQPEVVIITVLDMIPWAGPLIITILSLSTLVLLVSPILYFTVKSKRMFFIWLISQNIKLNLITAPLSFLWAMYKLGVTANFFLLDARQLNDSISEALFGPTYILAITFALFVLRFVLMARSEFNK